MHEIALQYNGKKKPFIFENPKVGKLTFSPTKGDVTWVTPENAEWLVTINPGMFSKTGERGAPDAGDLIFEDASEMIAKKAADDAKEAEIDELPDPPVVDETESKIFYTCEKCGRRYAEKNKIWYDKHIEKCEG